MIWNGNECGKILRYENLKATVPRTGYDRSDITGSCGLFQQFG
jgi:hypothetical protein